MFKKGSGLFRSHPLCRYGHTQFLSSADEAVKDIPSGSLLLSGGFGVCGVPMSLIRAIQRKGIDNLTVASNNIGLENYGLGLLLHDGNRIKRVISSYVGENHECEEQYFKGNIILDLTPQGTLAEKIRYGGMGIPAFYTPTGKDTLVEHGGFPIKMKPDGKTVEIYTKPKETRFINGLHYVMEESIFADFALVKAWRADKEGNLQYRMAARNLNYDMATAGKITIAEVEEIVENGEIPPDQVHTPSAFVNRIILSEEKEKPIEKLIYHVPLNLENPSPKQALRYKIAGRAAKLINHGMNVNLGIGIPTLVPSFIPPEISANIHSENGVLGVNGNPRKGEEDPDLINASKETIVIKKGACFFSTADSFAMVRGGHLDMTMLGGMQVDQNADLSNWIVPGRMVKGMGGAMDLVSNQLKVVILMKHTNANGSHKILEKCTLPVTGGRGCVDTIITDLAVFKFIENELTLLEVASESNLEAVRAATGCSFKIAENLGTF